MAGSKRPETFRHEGTLWAWSRVMSKQDNVTAVIANRARKEVQKGHEHCADTRMEFGFGSLFLPQPPAICTKMQMKTSQLTLSPCSSNLWMRMWTK